ncbi:fibronectin type III domain-containing protein [Patescibacteria group bacterium]
MFTKVQTIERQGWNKVSFLVGSALVLVFCAVLMLLARPVDAATVPAPDSLRLVTSKATSITVSWASDVRSMVEVDGQDAEDQAVSDTSYIVRVYKKKSGKRVKTVRTTETSATVGNLVVNRAYVVKAWAVRDGATSEPAELVVRTSPDAPRRLTAATVTREVHYDVISNEPVNQYGDSSSSKYLAHLSWKKPDGKVRYYIVKVYRVGRKGPIQTWKTYRPYVGVSGLKPGREYAFRVITNFNDDYASKRSARKKFRVKKI